MVLAIACTALARVAARKSARQTVTVLLAAIVLLAIATLLLRRLFYQLYGFLPLLLMLRIVHTVSATTGLGRAVFKELKTYAILFYAPRVGTLAENSFLWWFRSRAFLFSSAFLPGANSSFFSFVLFHLDLL